MVVFHVFEIVHWWQIAQCITFYYSTEDELLRKAFTNILHCCYIHFTYNTFHMTNL